MQNAPAPNGRLIAVRLDSATRRIRALLDQVEVLRASDFPHDDGESALEQIGEHFEGLLRELASAKKYSLKIAQDLCLKASLEVGLHLPVLGFILRSTNVRNAFETYDPLKSIVEKTIHPNAHLIVSSEWDFVPFTYPMSLDVLPDYVLVGGPAHESSSAYLTPIAGHEIGHSAWKFHDVLAQLDAPFTHQIEDLVSADPDLRQELEAAYGPTFSGLLRDYGIKRVEELFCDAFGLYLFGDAYFFAFEHLMYPGGEERQPDYPRPEDRVAFLAFCADRRRMQIDGDVSREWRSSSDSSETDADIDDVLDKAARAIYANIADAAYSIIEASRVPQPNEDRIGEAVGAFRAGVPVDREAALCDLICAGWRMIREPLTLPEGVDSRLINELILKSVEVSEFERRSAPC